MPHLMSLPPAVAAPPKFLLEAVRQITEEGKANGIVVERLLNLVNGCFALGPLQHPRTRTDAPRAPLGELLTQISSAKVLVNQLTPGAVKRILSIELNAIERRALREQSASAYVVPRRNSALQTLLLPASAGRVQASPANHENSAPALPSTPPPRQPSRDALAQQLTTNLASRTSASDLTRFADVRYGLSQVLLSLQSNAPALPERGTGMCLHTAKLELDVARQVAASLTDQVPAAVHDALTDIGRKIDHLTTICVEQLDDRLAKTIPEQARRAQFWLGDAHPEVIATRLAASAPTEIKQTLAPHGTISLASYITGMRQVSSDRFSAHDMTHALTGIAESRYQFQAWHRRNVDPSTLLERRVFFGYGSLEDARKDIALAKLEARTLADPDIREAVETFLDGMEKRRASWQVRVSEM